MNLRISCLLTLALPLALSAAAPAVIIDSADGTGNTGGWSPNVGTRDYGGVVVYLGNGWVLTANHIAAGDTIFAGTPYPWVSGSAVRLHNPDTSLADLVLFEIQPPYPLLPALPIAAARPPVGTALIMAGNGRDRGPATSWDPGPGPPIHGYEWAQFGQMRWGTNNVESIMNLGDFESAFGTKLFAAIFEHSGTDECQATTGDSGGPAFAWNGTSYDLAGILIGLASYTNQPAETALYGNYTFAADLSVYRDEIVETMPEPRGGLWAGAALLAWLSVGTRRACRGTGCAASSPPRA